jgi:hypothetical protein
LRGAASIGAGGCLPTRLEELDDGQSDKFEPTANPIRAPQGARLQEGASVRPIGHNTSVSVVLSTAHALGRAPYKESRQFKAADMSGAGT